MKKLRMIAGASVTSVVIAGLVISPVVACHPQGKIVKTVQDVTTNSEMSNGNSEDNAITVNTGDTLTYTVTVSNQETVEGAKHQSNMTNTVLTDELPEGLELISNPGQRTLTTDLGIIKAKGKVTKNFQVKVTEATDGTVITNKACYTSDSTMGKKYAQNGCDVAIVKVHVPVTPTPTPSPTPTPAPTITPQQPAATLPNTGAGNIVAPAVFASVLGYAGYLRRAKRLATLNK